MPAPLYGGGAGVNAFFVDAMGTLHPYLMSRTVGYDVSDGGFIHGWTETATNLALSLAMMGNSVLVIEADMRRPMVCTTTWV
ncbi:MAG: hypothetical protein KKA32_07365 [Actinobacteria bacterium]|nr:hypothetical protein [Actinomycetota bacterium]